MTDFNKGTIVFNAVVPSKVVAPTNSKDVKLFWNGSELVLLKYDGSIISLNQSSQTESFNYELNSITSRINEVNNLIPSLRKDSQSVKTLLSNAVEYVKELKIEEQIDGIRDYLKRFITRSELELELKLLKEQFPQELKIESGDVYFSDVPKIEIRKENDVYYIDLFLPENKTVKEIIHQGGGVSLLSQLRDVEIDRISTGQTIIWNGSRFVPTDMVAGDATLRAEVGIVTGSLQSQIDNLVIGGVTIVGVDGITASMTDSVWTIGISGNIGGQTVYTGSGGKIGGGRRIDTDSSDECIIGGRRI